MDHFFTYGGRGDQQIVHDSIFCLEPDEGAVLLVTRKIGKVEFVLAYCRSAIIERWGCYCIDPFHRASSSDLRQTWCEPLESELIIYHQVDVYLVPDEPWMTGLSSS